MANGTSDSGGTAVTTGPTMGVLIVVILLAVGLVVGAVSTSMMFKRSTTAESTPPPPPLNDARNNDTSATAKLDELLAEVKGNHRNGNSSMDKLDDALRTLRVTKQQQNGNESAAAAPPPGVTSIEAQSEIDKLWARVRTLPTIEQVLAEIEKRRAAAAAAAEEAVADDPTAEKPLTLERLDRRHRHDIDKLWIMLRSVPTLEDTFAALDKRRGELKIWRAVDALPTAETLQAERDYCDEEVAKVWSAVRELPRAERFGELEKECNRLVERAREVHAEDVAKLWTEVRDLPTDSTVAADIEALRVHMNDELLKTWNALRNLPSVTQLIERTIEAMDTRSTKPHLALERDVRALEKTSVERLDKLREELDAGRAEQHGALEQRIAALEQRAAAAADETKKSVDERLGKLEDANGGVETRLMARCDESITESRRLMAEKLEKLLAEHSAAYERLKSSVEAHKSRMDGQATRLDELDTSVQELRDSRTEHASALEKLKAGLKTYRDERKVVLDEHTRSIDELRAEDRKATLDEHGSSISAHGAAIDKHSAALREYKTSLQDLRKLVVQNGAAAVANDSSASGGSADGSSSDKALNDIRADIKALDKRVGEIDKSCDDLEQSLDRQVRDCNAFRATAVSKNKLREVRDGLASAALLDETRTELDKLRDELSADVRALETSTKTAKVSSDKAIQRLNETSLNAAALEDAERRWLDKLAVETKARNDRFELSDSKSAALDARIALAAKTESESLTKLEARLAALDLEGGVERTRLLNRASDVTKLALEPVLQVLRETDASNDRALRRYVDTEIEKVKAPQQRLDEESCQSIVDRVTGKLKREHTERAERLETSLTELGKSLDKLQHKSDARFVSLSDANTSTIKEWIADSAKHVCKPLDDRIDALRNRHETLHTTVVALQTSNEALRTSLAKLQNGHESLNGTVVALQTSHETLRTGVQQQPLLVSVTQPKLQPALSSITLNDDLARKEEVKVEIESQLRKYSEAAETLRASLAERVTTLEMARANNGGGNSIALALYDDKLRELETRLGSSIDSRLELLRTAIHSGPNSGKFLTTDVAMRLDEFGAKLEQQRRDIEAHGTRLTDLERDKALLVRETELTRRLAEERSTLNALIESRARDIRTQFDTLAGKMSHVQHVVAKTTSQFSAFTPTISTSTAVPSRKKTPVQEPPPQRVQQQRYQTTISGETLQAQLEALRNLYTRRFRRTHLSWPDLDEGRVPMTNLREFGAMLARDVGLASMSDWRERLHKRTFDERLTGRLVSTLERAFLDGRHDFARDLCHEFLDDIMNEHSNSLPLDFVAIYVLIPEAKHRTSVGQSLANRMIGTLDDRKPRDIDIGVLDDATIALLAIFVESLPPFAALDGRGVTSFKRSSAVDNKWLSGCVNMRFRRKRGLMRDATYVDSAGLLDMQNYESLAQHEFHEMARILYHWLDVEMTRIADPYAEYQRLRLVMCHPRGALLNEQGVQFARAGKHELLSPEARAPYGICVAPVYGFARLYARDDESYIVRVVQTLWPQFTVRQGATVGAMQEMVQGRESVSSLSGSSGHGRRRRDKSRSRVFGLVVSVEHYSRRFSGDDSVQARQAESFVMQHDDQLVVYQRYEIAEFGEYRVTELVCMNATSRRREYTLLVENLGSAKLSYVGYGGAEFPVAGGARDAFRTVLLGENVDSSTRRVSENSIMFPLVVPETSLRVLETAALRDDDRGAWILADLGTKGSLTPLVCVPRRSEAMLERRLRARFEGQEYSFEHNAITNQWDQVAVQQSGGGITTKPPDIVLIPEISGGSGTPIETTYYTTTNNLSRLNTMTTTFAGGSVAPSLTHRRHRL